MRKTWFQIFKTYFVPLFITMTSHNLLAVDELDFHRGTEATKQFKKARQGHFTVQLFSILDCTEEQAKEEIKRLVSSALKEDVNLLSHPLFATRVVNESYGWGAVGIFDKKEEAQKLANSLSFLKTKPLVRNPATKLALDNLKIEFVIYSKKK